MYSISLALSETAARKPCEEQMQRLFMNMRPKYLEARKVRADY